MYLKQTKVACSFQSLSSAAMNHATNLLSVQLYLCFVPLACGGKACACILPVPSIPVKLFAASPTTLQPPSARKDFMGPKTDIIFLQALVP